MTEVSLTQEQAIELKRLRDAHTQATEFAGRMLALHGMESPEFAKADAATAALWRKIREIQGMKDQPWNA